MAAVVVSRTAREDLERLIWTHSLPGSTRERVRRSIEPLADFPTLGAQLEGRWSSFRFILGPWRWMIVVYEYDREVDRVVVITIQDGRSGAAPSKRARVEALADLESGFDLGSKGQLPARSDTYDR